ncbi:O-succinylbenzoic acid--CoA ligase [Spirosoma oryzae]|uniref:O-succinylbenzoic acid--CoA ligase n=1 Tax=Spirosoma oryzae TaxID=1469603 RepID=A0A2T0SW64_9BACT|nr:AMP-binding protein [Spirosoma oryzae]PRY37652.1 O-succinylbenzoic acid--CoA ligase [Spirosoma oryzae]
MLLLPDRPFPPAQTDYEAHTQQFCRAWQSGQETFTLHTSGSTGTPKPIELTRAQMRASAQLTGQALGLQAGDSALVCLNTRYIAGTMMLVRGLELALPMTVVEPVSNPLIRPEVVGKSFAFTALVPLQLQTILTETPEKKAVLDGMKAILVGGAATSPALEGLIQSITAPVYATYGMTETVSHIALHRLNGPTVSDLFTALPGVDLGTDERGCLHITSAATNFERVQTNDVVDLRDATQFRLLGRADSVINSGGVKVQPEPVERLIQTYLAEHNRSPRLFIAGLPDDRLGQRVVLVLEGSSLTEPQWTTIQQIVRTALGPYSVPKAWHSVDVFSETPTGKIDRRATIDQIR